MSAPLTNRDEHQGSPTWAGSAFIVEAILLLAFLVASSAVFVQLFSAASLRSDESSVMATAVAAASTTAERFAGDPKNVQETTEYDGLIVSCKTDSVKRAGGTMYHADITVYASGDAPVGDGTVIYAVSTSTYVSEVSG